MYIFPPGQKTEDEPAAKKPKLTKKPENKPVGQDAHLSRSGDVHPVVQPQVSTTYPVAPSYPSNMDAAVPESPLYQDVSMLAPLAPPPATVAPTVSSVSITRRDPRMARHGSSVTVTYSAAPEKPSITNSAEALPAPISAPVDLGPKGPLPMPPAPPPSVSKPAKTRCSFSSL